MVHGGDIYRNQVELDFSVNINPLGIPAGVRKALLAAVEDCTRYPDLQSDELKSELETMTGINAEEIVCGNGASELFLAIVHAIRPRRVILPEPSFWGYEHAARAAGCEICHITMQQEDAFCLHEELLWENVQDGDLRQNSNLRKNGSRDILFLANPNNPVGNLMSPEQLERILDGCKKRNIIVVADECFIEFSGKEETHSLKTKINEYQNLIVVRAFTKFYAIPGVRLGYLLCGNKKLLEAIEKQLPEWNLSVFAQAAGTAACRETDYKKRTAEYVNRERTYLKGELEGAGMKVYPSEACYLLIDTELPLYDALLKRKILIRDCSNFPGLKKGYYRVAVRAHEENERLIQAVHEVRYEQQKIHTSKDCKNPY